MKFWTSYEDMRGLRVIEQQGFRISYKSLYISPSGKKTKETTK